MRKVSVVPLRLRLPRVAQATEGPLGSLCDSRREGSIHHLDSQLLLKIVVIVATAVVVVYFGSIGYLDFAATSTPDSTSAEALAEVGNYERAIKTYRADIATLETQTVNALLALADVYAKNEQPAEAEATYKKVLVRDPEELDAYVGLVALQRDQGRYEEAETTVMAGLEALPQNVSLLKLKDDLANRETSE